MFHRCFYGNFIIVVKAKTRNFLAQINLLRHITQLVAPRRPVHLYVVERATPASGKVLYSLAEYLDTSGFNQACAHWRAV